MEPRCVGQAPCPDQIPPPSTPPASHRERSTRAPQRRALHGACRLEPRPDALRHWVRKQYPRNRRPEVQVLLQQLADESLSCQSPRCKAALYTPMGPRRMVVVVATRRVNRRGKQARDRGVGSVRAALTSSLAGEEGPTGSADIDLDGQRYLGWSSEGISRIDNVLAALALSISPAGLTPSFERYRREM